MTTQVSHGIIQVRILSPQLHFLQIQEIADPTYSCETESLENWSDRLRVRTSARWMLVRIQLAPQPLQIAEMVLTVLGDIELETVDFMDR